MREILYTRLGGLGRGDRKNALELPQSEVYDRGLKVVARSTDALLSSSVMFR